MSHDSLQGYCGTSHLHTKGTVGCSMIVYYDTMIGEFEIYKLYSTPTMPAALDMNTL